MSVLWMDDPSYYATLTNQNIRYLVGIGGLTISAGNGRFGGNAWTAFSSSNWSKTQNIGTVVTGTAAISFNVTNLPATGNAGILSFFDSATLQCDLRITPAGTLLVTRNGTQIGSTSTFAFATNVWHRVEFKITIDASAGSIEVRVDGNAVIGPTGSLNTKNSAATNTSFNEVGFGNNVSGQNMTAFANDLVVTNTSSPNADFLGDVRCFLRLPNADSSVQWTNTWASFINSHSYALGDQLKDSNGNIQQVTVAGTSQGAGTPTWATTGGVNTTTGGVTFTVVGSGANPGAHNWMAVSEPLVDGDDSYNTDSTPGDTDLFTLPILPAGANGILAVDNVLYCRKDDAGVRTISNEISSGGTVANAPNLALSTSFVFNDFISETDPNTGLAWTVSAANNLLVGYEEIA